jgi:hypothetical protein
MATTTSTGTTEQTIPSELSPYFTGVGTRGQAGYVPGLLPTAQGVFSRDYATTYQPLQQAGLLGAGRVAGLAPSQQALGTQISKMTTPGEFGSASAYAQQGALGLQNLLNQQASTINAPSLNTFQLGDAGTFGQAQANQYMTPYIESALNPQLDAMRRQNAINQQAIGAKFAGSGAFGGGRQAIGMAQSNAENARQMNQAIGSGYQSAFTQAQQQYERDRAAQAGVNQQNLQAALGVQQLGAGQNLQAQQLNQAAGLQAAAQRAAAAQGLGNLAAQTGQLGIGRQAADIDRMKMLGSYGDMERSLAQQQLDTRYQDILRQIGYPEQQLSGMSALLRGTPLSSAQYQSSQMTPPPSFTSQLAGAGLSGLSLYNLMGKQ